MKANPREPAWPDGLRVWVAWEGEWRSGLVQGRPARTAVTVLLDEGRVVTSAVQRGLVVAKDPLGRPVPKSRRIDPNKGRAGCHLRGPDGRITGRDPSKWSARHDACVQCGTTERRHDARGLCCNCYKAWKYRNDPAFVRRARERSKNYRLRTDYDALRDERLKDDPKKRGWHRKASLKWYDRNRAKWPVGCRVRTGVGNVDLVGRGMEPRASERPSKGGPYIEGTVERKTNGAAYVRIETFALWLPFARLERVEEESRRAA